MAWQQHLAEYKVRYPKPFFKARSFWRCTYCSHFTPLWFIFSEGEGVRIPATSYLVPLFTLIYLVLFHLLPPYHLDVPSYLNNRQRYCSVWSERLRLFTTWDDT